MRFSTRQASTEQSQPVAVRQRVQDRAVGSLKCAQAFGVTVDELFADTGTCLRAAARSYEVAPIRAVSAGDGKTPVALWANDS